VWLGVEFHDLDSKADAERRNLSLERFEKAVVVAFSAAETRSDGRIKSNSRHEDKIGSCSFRALFRIGLKKSEVSLAELVGGSDFVKGESFTIRSNP
jgi:5-hydroxyisourate hydrolase-like protein (transthyretin family)